MSNPYAPPEDRPSVPAGGEAGPDAPEGVPGVPPGGAGVPGVPARGAPRVPAGGASAGQRERSPEGVPYERPRRTASGPAPHPTDLRRVAVLTRTTALLVLGSVLAGLLPFPMYLAAVLLVAAAVAVGIRALAVASRGHVRGAPQAVLGLLIAVALLGLARPALTLLTWDAESQYATCNAGALTVQAQNSCRVAYEQAIDERTRPFTRPTP